MAKKKTLNKKVPKPKVKKPVKKTKSKQKQKQKQQQKVVLNVSGGGGGVGAGERTIYLPQPILQSAPEPKFIQIPTPQQNTLETSALEKSLGALTDQVFQMNDRFNRIRGSQEFRSPAQENVFQTPARQNESLLENNAPQPLFMNEPVIVNKVVEIPKIKNNRGRPLGSKNKPKPPKDEPPKDEPPKPKKSKKPPKPEDIEFVIESDNEPIII